MYDQACKKTKTKIINLFFCVNWFKVNPTWTSVTPVWFRFSIKNTLVGRYYSSLERSVRGVYRCVVAINDLMSLYISYSTGSCVNARAQYRLAAFYRAAAIRDLAYYESQLIIRCPPQLTCATYYMEIWAITRTLCVSLRRFSKNFSQKTHPSGEN